MSEITQELKHPKKVLFAKLLAEGDKRTQREMAAALGVTEQSLIAWKKEPEVKAHIEKIKREMLPFNFDELNTMSVKQLSALRRRIDEVEDRKDPARNFYKALRGHLEEIADDKHAINEMLDEIVSIFNSYGISQQPKVEIIISGMPSNSKDSQEQEAENVSDCHSPN